MATKAPDFERRKEEESAFMAIGPAFWKRSAVPSFCAWNAEVMKVCAFTA
jgi:hypothetical protein